MQSPGALITNSSKLYLKIIGGLFIVLALIVSLIIACPTGVQYFIIYTLIGVGIALILAKSAEKSRAKFTINKTAIILSGGVALPFILFFANPISKLKPDSCPLYTNIMITVHGKDKQDIILKQKGSVIMDIIGKETKRSSINENGQAFFQNLLIGDSVRLNIDFSEPYKAINPDSIYVIKLNENIYLSIKLMGIDKVWGKVIYNNGPLAGVAVELEGKIGELETITNNMGDFNFIIPEPMQQKKYDVIVIKKGFKTDTVPAYPETGEWLKIVMGVEN